MIVCITEKPKVGESIAAILGANKRCDGFYEGNGYCVTWTFGHLCTLKEPADYTDLWKRWSLGSLPMIPPRFGIKLMDQKSIQHQFNVIETLVGKADKVINCGDAGQEGELIQRWVLQLASVKCPVMRLWTSSLTDEAIREAFANQRPEADYNNLYHAGLSRAIGDWLLGLNATRLYSLKYSEPGKVLSVGRVQTPTLALMAKRHREIAEFVPEDFWELRTVYRDTTFNSALGRFKTEESAKTVVERIAKEPFEVTDVQKKKGKEFPPRLFDLTSLQVEANKRWGWSADETLQLIQSLYEKKVTTYPRVDTTYLSEDIHKTVPDILRKMTPYAALTAPVLAKAIPKSKRVFDNSKVTDHHAIIPTGESPSRLAGNERLLYHLIATRFIANFYPECIVELTTVEGRVTDVGFKANGKVIVSPGWRDVLDTDKGNDKSKDKEGENDQDRLLPPFVKGESGPHKPDTIKRVTTPPKLYTEGTLLKAMETAGRTVEDETLREALKENGLGRPSTRASIIETLIKRGYIRRTGKSIDVTDAGLALIDTIDEPLLKSAKLTGLWENKLRRIERGDYSPAAFLDELKTMVNEIVINVLSDNSRAKIIVKPTNSSGKGADTKDGEAKPRKKRSTSTEKRATTTKRISKYEDIECPKCHQGHIIKGKTAFGCSRFREGCDLRLMFTDYPEDLTPGKLKKAIEKK